MAVIEVLPPRPARRSPVVAVGQRPVAAVNDRPVRMNCTARVYASWGRFPALLVGTSGGGRDEAVIGASTISGLTASPRGDRTPLSGGAPTTTGPPSSHCQVRFARGAKVVP